jgi:hypothetical protein
MRTNGLAISVVLVSLAAALGGCATTPTDPNTIVYPDGSYKMYGDGTTTPYYWVWIPNGASAPVVPTPPPIPTNQAPVVVAGVPTNQPAVVVQPGVAGVAPTVVAPPPDGCRRERTVPASYGNGTTQPYYLGLGSQRSHSATPPPLPLR